MSLYKKPPFVPMTTVWIETGTYLGDGVEAALLQGYSECISIERNRPIYERSVSRFRLEPRVQILFGSSPDILPSVIDPAKTTTFWLDGHYSGSPGERDEKYGECPIIAELEVITRCAWKFSPVILIDDAFMFLDWVDDPGCNYLQSTYCRSEWPTLSEIRSRFPNYEISVHPTQDGQDPVNLRGMLVVTRRT